MRSVIGLLYGIYALGAAILWALLSGTFTILPFFVLRRGRRERYAMTGAQIWARGCMRAIALSTDEVTGTVDLPAGQGALFLCNHRSWLDPIMMIAYTRSNGLSKAEILWIPVIGFYGWLTGAVFFHRGSKEQRQRARKEVIDLLHAGHRIHVFPEGTRSRDGELRAKVYLTLARDCFAQGLPVVPCAIVGTERIMPASESGVWPGETCRLDIGPALWPRDFPDDETFAQACWDGVKERVTALTLGHD